MKSSKNTHSWTTKIQYGGHQQSSKIAKSPSFNEMLSDFGEIWYITAYHTVTPSHGSVVRASQREKTNLPPLTTPTPLNRQSRNVAHVIASTFGQDCPRGYFSPMKVDVVRAQNDTSKTANITDTIFARTYRHSPYKRRRSSSSYPANQGALGQCSCSVGNVGS